MLFFLPLKRAANFIILPCTSIFLFFISQLTYAQDLKFRHLTIDEGLSSNRVNVVVQDLDGYMWVGTSNGLNRYNGYEVKTYVFEPKNKYSISGSDIQTIYEDKRGTLWIGTNGGGFCYYDKAQDRFVRMPYFENCYLSVFMEDNDDNLWVFGRTCIGKFSSKTKKFEDISSQITNMPTIERVVKSNESHLFWIGTSNKGLYTLNVKNQQLTPFNDTKDTFSSKEIMSLYLDIHKVLWIGYYSPGKIDCFDTQSKTIKHITHQDNTPNNIPNFPITCFMEVGNQMWIGTRNGGLCIFDNKTQNYITYSYQKNDKNSLNSNSIASEAGL